MFMTTEKIVFSLHPFSVHWQEKEKQKNVESCPLLEEGLDLCRKLDVFTYNRTSSTHVKEGSLFCIVSG